MEEITIRNIQWTVYDDGEIEINVGGHGGDSEIITKDEARILGEWLIQQSK